MKRLTYSQAFQLGVREEMARDDSIIILGTDLYIRGGHWAQVKGIGPEFGSDRVRDTPISEAAMVGAAVGAALNGLRPIVDLNFIDFAFGAMDELVNQAAKIRYMWDVGVPVVVRATSGVAFGGPQHNNQVEGWFANTPGLVVATPSSAADVRGLIKTALRGADPVVFLMHKLLTGARGPVDPEGGPVPFGVANIVRPGGDVTIATYGIGVSRALTASEQLTASGIECEVVDLRTVWPLDLETVVSSVRKTGRLLVLSEATGPGSVGSHVAVAVGDAAFAYLDAPVRHLGALHSPIAHSPALMEMLVPQPDDVARAVRELATYDIASAGSGAA